MRYNRILNGKERDKAFGVPSPNFPQPYPFALFRNIPVSPHSLVPGRAAPGPPLRSPLRKPSSLSPWTNTSFCAPQTLSRQPWTTHELDDSRSTRRLMKRSKVISRDRQCRTIHSRRLPLIHAVLLKLLSAERYRSASDWLSSRGIKTGMAILIVFRI